MCSRCVASCPIPQSQKWSKTPSRPSTTPVATIITSIAATISTKSTSRFLSAINITMAPRAIRFRKPMLPMRSINRQEVCPMWKISTKTTRSTNMSATSNIASLSAPKIWWWAKIISSTNKNFPLPHATARKRPSCGINSVFLCATTKRLWDQSTISLPFDLSVCL